MATATAPAKPPGLTEAQDSEVLSHIFEAKGPAAVADLVAGIALADQRARQMADQFAARRPGAPFSTPFHLVVHAIVHGVASGRTLRARVAALAKQGSAEASAAVAGFPVGTAEAEAQGILLATCGQPGIDHARKFLAAHAASLRVQLASAVAAIDSLKRTHAGGAMLHDPHGDPHGAIYAPLSGQVAARDLMAADLAELDELAALVPKVQAARASDAVAKAGGPAAVATGVREAWSLSPALRTPDPGSGDIRAKADALAAVDAQVAQLDGAGGSLAAALAADRKQAASDLDAAKAAASGRIKAGASALVDSATRGDEAARALIEAAADAQPRAFPANFAQSIMEAQFEYSPEDGPKVVSLIARLAVP